MADGELVGGVRPEVVRADVPARTVVIFVRADAAPGDVVYRAAHALIDRAWVLLGATSDGGGFLVHATLKDRDGSAERALTELADAFATEAFAHLMAHRLRERHGERVQRIILKAVTNT